jgi:hypothetical protein
VDVVEERKCCPCRELLLVVVVVVAVVLSWNKIFAVGRHSNKRNSIMVMKYPVHELGSDLDTKTDHVTAWWEMYMNLNEELKTCSVPTMCSAMERPWQVASNVKGTDIPPLIKHCAMDTYGRRRKGIDLHINLCTRWRSMVIIIIITLRSPYSWERDSGAPGNRLKNSYDPTSLWF